tara:strand:- start:1678 stop:2427 length:750 start_codon:yes stop_codon:yes gene_type:complete
MKALTVLTMVLVVISGCASSGGSLDTALKNRDRAQADRDRDAGRKPAQVIQFLGIGEGMTVIDMIAASGYYTEVLSLAVGPSGKVYAQNPASVLQYRNGANEKALAARLNGRLANVERLDAETNDMGLPPNSIDAVVTALNLHDIYNGMGAAAAQEAVNAVFEILKPGGVFGVIDHAGNPGANNEEMHRMEEQQAEQLLTRAGFEIESSPLLRNPNDTRNIGVFFPQIRGNTDRFLIRATKPSVSAQGD